MPPPSPEIKETPAVFSVVGRLNKPRQLGLLFVLLLVLSFYVLWKVGAGIVPVSSSPSALSVTPTNTPTLVETQEGKMVLAGTIAPLSVPQGLGTHKLVDAQGQTLAILTSRKLDLDFTVPGVVEVRGKILKTLEEGKPLLQVESLGYRRSGEEK